MYYPENYSFVYIGTFDGNLYVLDLTQNKLTSYKLRFQLLFPELNSDPVVHLSFRPCKNTQLLLAFENAGMVLWDLKKSKVEKKMPSSTPIHSVSWSPDGNSLVCGLRDGSLNFWTVQGKPFMYKNLRPDSNASDLNVSAIDRVVWTSSGLVIQGGRPFHDSSQLMVLSGNEMNSCENLKLPSKPLNIIYTPVFENGAYEEALTVVTQDSKMLLYSFGKLPCYLPQVMGPFEVECTKFYTVPNDGEQVADFIKTFENNSEEPKENILDIYGLLVMAHSQGLVRLWSLSKLRFRNLINISLLSEEETSFLGKGTHCFQLSDKEHCKVSALEFNFDTKTLVTAYDLGKVAIWQIFNSEVTLLHTLELQKSPILALLINSNTLLAGNLDAQLSVFNLETQSSNTLNLRTGRKSNSKMQALAITSIELHGNKAVISLSNGKLEFYSISQETLLESPKSPRVDKKSETPKWEDYGIVRLITCVQVPETMFVCYKKCMFQTSPSLEVQTSQYWNTPIVSAAVNYFKSNVVITLLHEDASLSMLEAGTLLKVWSGKLDVPVEVPLKDFHMSLDGHFVATSDTPQVVTGWLTLQDEETNFRKINIFNPTEDPLPPRKYKSFLGIKLGEFNFNDIFAKPPKKCFYEEKPKHEEVKTEELQNELERAQMAVKERGEKLESLEERTSQMAEQAKGWADMVSEYAKKQKKKKWWQF